LHAFNTEEEIINLVFAINQFINQNT
jgi:hypothetical protein